MDRITRIIMVLFTIIGYVISLVSAIFVFPYIWLPVGVMLALIGVFWLYKYKYKNRGVLAISIFTNGTFVALGQYLEIIVPAISILINILGVIMSVLMMLIWYYWKEGQRHVRIRVKNEKVEEDSENHNPGFFEKAKFILFLIKKQEKYRKEKGYSRILAFQFAYVEFQEEKRKQEEKNALDFVLGKEVILQRNEYDQSPDK